MDTQIKFKTSPDANLLKLIAMISMAIGRVGIVFFRNIRFFGRLGNWIKKKWRLFVIFLVRLILRV